MTVIIKEPSVVRRILLWFLTLVKDLGKFSFLSQKVINSNLYHLWRCSGVVVSALHIKFLKSVNIYNHAENK